MAGIDLWKEEPWTRLIARISGAARKRGWEPREVVNEVAVDLLARSKSGDLPLVSEEQFLPYAMTAARNIMRCKKSINLERRRRRLRHERLPERRDAREFDCTAISSGLINDLPSGLDPATRLFVEAVEELPFGKSCTSYVAAGLRVSRPTARRRIDEAKHRLRRILDQVVAARGK
jgi:hypothetical protein